MKLNYREKVILGILIAIIICVAGFVGLIKPKNNDIKEDKAALADKQKEKDEIQSKIDQIVPLTNDINDTYAATNKLVGDFADYDNIYRTTNLDQFLQQYADECEIKITALNLENLKEAPLPYYYFGVDVVGEKSLQQADVNGSVQEQLDKDREESKSLSSRTTESVLTSQYAMTIIGTKENIWKYMQAIEEQEETVLINSVNISDYTFEGETDSDGKIKQKEDGESEANIVISVYSIYEMSKPNTDAD